jgi:hypothetical protein
MPGILQATAIGIGISPVFGWDVEGGVVPGRALILLEDGPPDAYLLESGDYYLLEA